MQHRVKKASVHREFHSSVGMRVSFCPPVQFLSAGSRHLESEDLKEQGGSQSNAVHNRTSYTNFLYTNVTKSNDPRKVEFRKT